MSKWNSSQAYVLLVRKTDRPFLNAAHISHVWRKIYPPITMRVTSNAFFAKFLNSIIHLCPLKKYPKMLLRK